MTRPRNATRDATRPGSRPGFTLVELLVVLGLILLLLGIALAVNASGIADSYKTTGAADRVSGWLLIAKNKAQRDRAPRGVRFIVDPATQQIREAQYIEVPDSYTPAANAGTGLTPRLLFSNTGTPAQRRVFLADANTADLAQSVFPNDVLFLPDFNTLHTLQTGVAQFQAPVSPPAGLPPGAVELIVRNPALLPAVPAGTGATYATTAFGFHRQPQPAIGEPTLQLTGDTVVDGAVSQPAMTADFDVLFAPSGEVINASRGQIVLWVRDVRLPFAGIGGTRAQYEEAGQMALIAVYSKTGAIATQPVLMPPNTDPYGAVKDAVNTGL